MFLGFLLFLREGGLKVSLNEWLALMEGLYRGFHGQTLRGFYVLCKTLLIKKETDLDRFEELFREYFKNASSEELKEELNELMKDKERAARVFSGFIEGSSREAADIIRAAVEDLAASEAATGDERIPGGVITGASMIQGAGGKSIVHLPGDRRFRDWRTDCTIESRQFQMAFRLLRELSRKADSRDRELDIQGTVSDTCRRGGILEIKTRPPRKNRLKLMVLIDSGGSMRPYEQLCSLLFQSLYKANTFSDLKIYYFHNCLEGNLYKDPSIDIDNAVETDRVLRNISGDYRVIFVGDADMALHELKSDSLSFSGGRDSSSFDGLTWFKKFRDKYSHSIWLHPQEREENPAWMPESFTEIEKVFPMFRLSIDGLKDGMYRLMKN